MKSILSQALQSELDNAPTLTATFNLGGQSIRVGSKPITAKDFEIVNKTKGLKVNFQTDPTQFEGQISMLILKTRMLEGEGEDETLGEKAFSVADKPALARIGVERLTTMFTDLFGEAIGFEEEDTDTVKGNS